MTIEELVKQLEPYPPGTQISVSTSELNFLDVLSIDFDEETSTIEIKAGDFFEEEL